MIIFLYRIGKYRPIIERELSLGLIYPSNWPIIGRLRWSSLEPSQLIGTETLVGFVPSVQDVSTEHPCVRTIITSVVEESSQNLCTLSPGLLPHTSLDCPSAMVPSEIALSGSSVARLLEEAKESKKHLGRNRS